MLFIPFVLLAVAVVFLSIKLAKYVDLLDKTSKISGAFIGGVLLAAVTSLPELFTSITATAIGENGLIIGNILGSNHIDLVILAAAILILFKQFKGSKISCGHILSLVFILITYGIVALGMLVDGFPMLGWVSLASILVMIVYVIYIIKTPKTSEVEEDVECSLTKKQIITRFIIASVLLVVSSIFITLVTDKIATDFNLGKSFAGALLLGITTSLPELAATFSLFSRGNHNAAIADILGSCNFNFLILAIGDMISFKEGNVIMYISDVSSNLLLLFGALSAVLFVFIILFKVKEKSRPKINYFAYVFLSTLVITSYILFVALSTNH